MTRRLRGASACVTPGNTVAEKEVSGAILHRISHASHIAVRDTAAKGGDFEAVATGLVAGAIESATNMGVSREEAAAAAADGALRAADIVGSPAFETVEKAVTQSIDGVQVVMKKTNAQSRIVISRPVEALKADTNQAVQITELLKGHYE